MEDNVRQPGKEKERMVQKKGRKRGQKKLGMFIYYMYMFYISWCHVLLVFMTCVCMYAVNAVNVCVCILLVLSCLGFALVLVEFGRLTSFHENLQCYWGGGVCVW